MKELLCSLASELTKRQEIFWAWIDQTVRRLVIEFTEKVLQLSRYMPQRWMGARNGLFYSVIGKVASTHGSLNQPSSVTFAMTMLGELPPALRLEEVMPNLKKLQRD